MKFEEDTELIGYFKLHIWVEAEGHNDMDIFVNIQKLDEQGKWLPASVLGEPHPGAWGKIRVSRRALDPKLSKDFQPVQAHSKDEKLSPDEIIPIDIEIYPTSRIWHKGQKIRLQIAGHYVHEGWFEPFFWDINNKGNHVIQSGGKYDSTFKYRSFLRNIRPATMSTAKRWSFVTRQTERKRIIMAETKRKSKQLSSDMSSFCFWQDRNNRGQFQNPKRWTKNFITKKID